MFVYTHKGVHNEGVKVIEMAATIMHIKGWVFNHMVLAAILIFLIL